MTSNEKAQTVIASGIIISNKQLLVLKRLSDAERAPGRWELPSGKVAFGESPLEALVRIVREQTGLSVTAGKLIHSTSFISKLTQNHIIIFYNLADLQKPENLIPKVILNAEHAGYQWADKKFLQQNPLEKHLSTIIGNINLYLDDSGFVELAIDNKTTYERVIINTDGGSRGNPGPSASGYVIMDENENIVEEGGEYLGITTNNQAEYHAVKLALQAVEKYHPKEIEFRIDSLLVVNQMKGTYKIRNKDLWPIHDNIKHQIAKYRKVNFIHVYRELNVPADAKVNEVLDSYQEK